MREWEQARKRPTLELKKDIHMLKLKAHKLKTQLGMVKEQLKENSKDNRTRKITVQAEYVEKIDTLKIQVNQYK